jgi:hypothetical protein
LIRANLHVDPNGLTLGEWGERYAEAIWLEQWRLDQHSRMLGELLTT